VIELRARFADPPDITALGRLRELLGSEFVTHRDIRLVQARLDFQSTGEATNYLDNAIVGLRLDSEDGRWIVQASNTALAVSRLAPYETWEDLRTRTEAVWHHYCVLLKPIAVTRLGVRYINRIVLKGETIDFDHAFTAGPRIPSRMPQELAEFLQRTVIPIREQRVMLTLTQAMESSPPPPADPQVSVLLDIDAYNEDAHEVLSPDVWSTLERLREAKNLAFFSSLTPATLEPMK